MLTKLTQLAKSQLSREGNKLYVQHREVLCTWRSLLVSRHSLTSEMIFQTMIFLPKPNRTNTETRKCSFKYLEIINSPGSFMQHDCKNKLCPSLFRIIWPPSENSYNRPVNCILRRLFETIYTTEIRIRIRIGIRIAFIQVSSHIRGICSNGQKRLLNVWKLKTT